MARDLSHIQDFQVDASALDAINGSVSVGSLQIGYSVDPEAPSVTLTAQLAGVTIGTGTLTPSNAQLTLGGGVSGLKAEVVLTANFQSKQVTYDATLTAPLVGSTERTGTLISW